MYVGTVSFKPLVSTNSFTELFPTGLGRTKCTEHSIPARKESNAPKLKK